MSQAYNTFMDSYFKRLKRPEFFNYNADQSFGANMVHGSEEQNPWANRDRDNAKYGNLGGANNNNIVQGPQAQTFEGGQIDPSLIGKTFTIPGGMGGVSGPANQGSSPFNTMLSTGSGILAKSAGKYLGDKAYGAINDWMESGPSSFQDKLSDMGGGYEKLWDSMTTDSTSAFSNAIGSGSEAGADALGGATDAAGSASSAMPFIGAGLKLGVGAATGQLQKKPGSTIGSAAGGAIGGAVGSIFGPVGTLVGSMAGSQIGGKVGGFIERPSLQSGMEIIKPPDMESMNPTKMLSSLFGGGKQAAPAMKLDTPKMNIGMASADAPAMPEPEGGVLDYDKYLGMFGQFQDSTDSLSTWSDFMDNYY